MKKKRIIGLVILLAVSVLFANENTATRRFGLFIGANNGGGSRTRLRYAVSDAQAVAKVFSEMGGISGEDSLLLLEPGIDNMSRQIQLLESRVSAAKESHRRTEVVFYYSGHSDEDGLLLGRERYAYRELRERINRIPSDMRIVILDSCSSGAFTRTKGGVKTQPFLIDDSMSAEGYAFLTSSSASEVSQESDLIEGSYFTHSLLAGLRGAADSVGDGRVTLNEVYRFAYTETLAKTETSLYGAQHPSYDMQVSGTGDVVLTDIKETSASLYIDAATTGRISIRDASNHLIAEINKVSGGKAMELGLESGYYTILLQQGDLVFQADLYLPEGRRTNLAAGSFKAKSTGQAVARGGEEVPEEPEIYPVVPFSFQVIPSLWFSGRDIKRSTNNFLLGLLGADGYNLKGVGLAPLAILNYGEVTGVQAAGIFTVASGDLSGVQAAGIFNIAGKDIKGMQGAGIFNIAGKNVIGAQDAGIFNISAGDIEGLQGAGIFNFAGGSVRGLQGAGIFNWNNHGIRGVQGAGIFNYGGKSLVGLQAGLVNWVSGDTRGVQMGLINRGGDGAGAQFGLINISSNESVFALGLINIVKNGILHPAIWYDDMGFANVSFRSGSKYVYSLLAVGAQQISLDSKEISFAGKNSENLLVQRFGIGFELPLGPVFLDLDFLGGYIVNLDIREESNFSQFNRASTLLAQARFTAGFKLFKHLGAFVGVSYDYLHPFGDNGPVPDSFAQAKFSWSDEKNIHRMGLFAGIQF